MGFQIFGVDHLKGPEPVINSVSSQEKIRRFDEAYKLLYDLSFQAPEVRPSNVATIEALGAILVEGKEG